MKKFIICYSAICVAIFLVPFSLKAKGLDNFFLNNPITFSVKQDTAKNKKNKQCIRISKYNGLLKYPINRFKKNDTFSVKKIVSNDHNNVLNGDSNIEVKRRILIFR